MFHRKTKRQTLWKCLFYEHKETSGWMAWRALSAPVYCSSTANKCKMQQCCFVFDITSCVFCWYKTSLQSTSKPYFYLNLQNDATVSGYEEICLLNISKWIHGHFLTAKRNSQSLWTDWWNQIPLWAVWPIELLHKVIKARWKQN